MEIQIKTTLSIRKKNKYESVYGETQNNPFEQVLNIIFIEKICQPIDKRIRQQYVQKFAGKMEMLHHKLRKIQNQSLLKITAENENKFNLKTKQSIQGSNTLKVIDWRKIIRTIQTKYIELFQQGSFKHYKKIMYLNNYSYKLDIFQIRQWATNCINKAQSQNKSCCCC